jgi:hypothetical protein
MGSCRGRRVRGCGETSAPAKQTVVDIIYIVAHLQTAAADPLLAAALAFIG